MCPSSITGISSRLLPSRPLTFVINTQLGRLVGQRWIGGLLVACLGVTGGYSKRLVLAGYRKMSLSSIQIYGCRLQRVQQH